MGFVSRRNPEVFGPVQSPGWRQLHHSMNEGWANLRSRSDADSCATSRAHTVGSRENVRLSHRTPPAVMHTSRYLNSRVPIRFRDLALSQPTSTAALE